MLCVSHSFIYYHMCLALLKYTTCLEQILCFLSLVRLSSPPTRPQMLVLLIRHPKLSPAFGLTQNLGQTIKINNPHDLLNSSNCSKGSNSQLFMEFRIPCRPDKIDETEEIQMNGKERQAASSSGNSPVPWSKTWIDARCTPRGAVPLFVLYQSPFLQVC